MYLRILEINVLKYMKYIEIQPVHLLFAPGLAW